MIDSLSDRTRFDLEGIEVTPAARTETVNLLAMHESRRTSNGDEVSADYERAIITAARSAPTSSNLQAYSILVVRDPARRSRLAKLVGDQRYVEQAPLFLVFCADIYRLRLVCERQGHAFAADNLEMFLLASIDAALCMQNALTAAESLGLGGVPIGSVRNDPEGVATELALPNGVVATVGLAISWPSGSGRGPKPRLPDSATVHPEQYSTEGLVEAIEEYDSTMIAREVYRNRQVGLRSGQEQLPANKYGWSEHTARRCSDPGALGPASLREHLREQVQQRGFGLR